MAKNNFYKYIGVMALGSVIMAAPSCSDTWDDHYAALEETDPAATHTLWEQIKSNPNLSRFADIAEKAKMYKDDKHPMATYTFKDLLSSNRVVTVWAPENSCFTDEEYKEWLQKCETDGYTVQQQLLGNHITTWRYTLNGEKLDTLKMINSKNLIFDRKARTIGGVAIKECNIPAVNGTLNTIGQLTPFDFNFYEYIKFKGTMPKFREYILSKDTTYFFESASIEGLPDENGNPTYVDSVYRTYNRLFDSYSYLPATNPEDWLMVDKGFGYGSSLIAEDSMFIMVMPTDQAWDKAESTLSSYYNYAPVYINRKNGLKQAESTDDGLNADSLKNMSMGMDIVSPLVFNVHKQPRRGGKNGTPWTLESFIQFKSDSAEYLLNCRYDTLRSTNQWEKTALFNGNYVKMSNGYGYEVNEWAFPTQFYKPDVIVEMGWGAIYDMTNNTTGTFTSVSFSNSTYKAITSKYGKVSKDNFYQLKQAGTGTNPKCDVVLQTNTNEAYVTNGQVMSGKYDIYLVMVPLWYVDLSNIGECGEPFAKYEFNYEIDPETNDTLSVDSILTPNVAYIDSLSGVDKNKLNIQINYNNGVAKEATSSKVTISYDANKVDTVLAVADFEFPYSYKNLRYSYPTMTIQGAPSSTEVRNKGFKRDICIDRIILRSKENGEIKEIDPNVTEL